MAKTLAWNETLEIHELVASQANQLMDLKSSVKMIRDANLKRIILKAINGLERNVRELLQFFPAAPKTTGRNK